MKILLLCHAFNSLTQRLFVELQEQGHEVSVEFDINDSTSEEAVRLFQPELIIAPYLKRAIPASIWQKHTCLIVHPGIIGDRGPSALDWAILNNVDEWGVTVLQANAEMDAGDIWASVNFPMRKATKASLYRNEVTEAAVEAVLLSVEHFKQPGFRPTPLAQVKSGGDWKPAMTQLDRAIDWWSDDSDTVLRKIRSADGFPGVRCELFERELYLYDASLASHQQGEPGQLLGHDDEAACFATRDGAVWIGHIKDKHSEHPFKLPAARVLEKEISGFDSIASERPQAVRRVEKDRVGYLHFDFHNGAMNSEQCDTLRNALVEAKQRPLDLIVLMGGQDFWSNGMHLNAIEAADSAADESWRNINAIDDLALEIINSPDQLIISALQGNAGAGGVFLARAADEVWARKGVILNPHYKDMGNLYGSEYWSYLLPRHAGEAEVERISQSRLPMGTREASKLGLLDHVIDARRAEFTDAVESRCQAYLQDKVKSIRERLENKRIRRQQDEAEKPLAAYREEELARMQQNFYGFDPSYHVARYNFVYKIPKSRTPLTIATHRRKSDIIRKVS